MNVRKGENKRESWWVTNLTNDTITIGDLLLLPALKPGKRVDLLHHYSREKISHSKLLPQLVKARMVTLTKDKLSPNNFPGPIGANDVDDAITPAEENEIDSALRNELEDFIDMSVVTEVGDPGTDSNIVTEQGIRESLLDEITEGQEILATTDGAILYGKDPDGHAAAVGISGEDNNKVQTINIDIECLLEDIYIELIKANIQMAIMTGNEIKNKEIHPH